jgi:integrating conjugative element membrane protein (TIGR03745 family)
MKQVILATRNRISAVKYALMTMMVMGINSAYAALPTTAAPSNAAAQGDYIGLAKGYAYDILILGGLIIGAIAFYTVAANAIGVYKEIGAGKKEWSDLGMHVLAGVLLLVMVVYLLTEASTVIF